MNVSDALIKEPYAAYHEQRQHYVTSHALLEWSERPDIYKMRMDGKIKDVDRPVFTFGRVAHSYILEGKSDYTIRDGPINPATNKPYGKDTKAYAAWEKESEDIEGDTLTSEEDESLRRMCASIYAHEETYDILCSNGLPERVIRSSVAGMPAQIRMDWLRIDMELIVDLKTCENLDKFVGDCYRFGYLFQAAFYCSTFWEATGVCPTFAFIAVEKQTPYRCGVWRVSRDSLKAPTKLVYDSIDTLSEAILSGVWPNGYEKTRTL